LSNYINRSNTFYGNRRRNWYDYFVSFQYLVYSPFGLYKTLCTYNDQTNMYLWQMKDNKNEKRNTTLS
jgi:hypothetical protein